MSLGLSLTGVLNGFTLTVAETYSEWILNPKTMKVNIQLQRQHT